VFASRILGVPTTAGKEESWASKEKHEKKGIMLSPFSTDKDEQMKE